jgi:hypothetical protein
VDPHLWELLRAEAGTSGERVVEAIIRLAEPGIDIPDVRMVSRFGTVATCRIRARDVLAVRALPYVLSVKASSRIGPAFEPAAGADRFRQLDTRVLPSDIRRSPGLSLTGAGVVVAAVDWGLDVDSAAFRWPDQPSPDPRRRAGGTRLIALWDQRDRADRPPPDPYGYGVVHTRQEIDRALADPRPYERIGYHPAISDRRGQGTHGTRTMDIAAGSARPGAPSGVAPEADLLFVHLADQNTGGLANFGDSVRLLEAVDFISRTAGPQPCVINISAGRICGPKDGSALVEQAFDQLLASTRGRFICNSAGNYYRWRAHSRGALAQGEEQSISLVIDPTDVTVTEVEIWYDGADEFAIRLDPPGYSASEPVLLGERTDLLADGRITARLYHRERDPANHANHFVAYVDPVGLPGEWTITLEGRQVRNGRFDAWIERDDSCPGCQARFKPEDSTQTITIGSIASSHLPLIVGAYNAHDPERRPGTFSSAGPCRDGRPKPDCAAPGVGVLAARSAPLGATRSTDALVRGNGTSFATPHVTGAVALCFQAAGDQLTARELRSLVLGSSEPVARTDTERQLGQGYLHLGSLVAHVRRHLRVAAAPSNTKESGMATDDPIVLLATAPATAYREYLYRPEGQLARWLSARFTTVARPCQQVNGDVRPGDVLLEVSLGRIGPGRCRTLTPEGRDQLAARRRLTPGQLLLRPLPRVELSEPQPTEPDVDSVVRDLYGAAEPAPREAIEVATAEYDYGDDDAPPRTPVPVDAAAAVPPFDKAERARITEPLLSARSAANAATWNSAQHPASSGVTLEEIRAALGSYVDSAAVRAAIERYNEKHRDDQIGAAGIAEAVLAECVHQFQLKCYRQKAEHDGRAGESTLDSLGLTKRSGPGFHGGLRHNERAQARLHDNDAKVQAITANEFSASNWYSGIVDPSVFGIRTKGHHGLHVLLVRRLRQAERYLLTLPAFRGMTPAALGAALGIDEQHGGMRGALTGSMHTFGLAIDIGYLANPWLHRTETWHAIQHAAALVSGTSLQGASAPDYFHLLGSDPARSTGDVWDELHRRHSEFVTYLGLARDNSALRAALQAGQQRGTAGLIEQGESLDQAVSRWKTRITAERESLGGANGDFIGRNPEHGFLAHKRDLVIALRDHGCLAWGAVDQGPGERGSGDVMHFDARVAPVGLALARGKGKEWINYVPRLGHHPCLRVSSAPAEEASASEADRGSPSDYLGGKLWTFTATTVPLPVSVFCPKAALGAGEVEVLVYAHGLLGPCSDRREHRPADFITDPPFSFGHIVHNSGRPVVLVVPLLNWARPGGARAFGDGREHWHELAAASNLNGLIAEVQAEVGRVQGLAAPSVQNLIIAGHSRAYDFLEPLAYQRRIPAMRQGALASLSEVWAFDTTYAGNVERWTDWLAQNPRLRVHLFYIADSKTADIGREFYRNRGPRLIVAHASEKHCYIPAAHMLALLSARGAHAGEAVAEVVEEYSDEAEVAEAGLEGAELQGEDVEDVLFDPWEFDDFADEAATGERTDSEDDRSPEDRFSAARGAVRTLASSSRPDIPAVLKALRSLGSVEVCRIGEDRELVSAIADHLAGADLSEASIQLARGRLKAMGRADLGRIIAAPANHSLGTLAGAHGHDVLLAHQERFDRTGTGTVHGNRSGVPKPAGTISTDCTEYVLTALDDAFAAKGLSAEWRAVRATAVANSRPEGLKGTEVIKALQADQRWQAVFWAPSPRDPEDGKSEHPFAYRKVREHGTYYGIAVDRARSVINYRPKGAAHPPDLSGVEKLCRLQFGILAARGGTHMAMIVNGEVHEVHWTTPATSRDAITATPLEVFGWQSGVIAAPPGDLDLAWHMP